MKIGSLCSGIGGLDIAVTETWRARGIESHPAWFAEQDQYASQVLADHWPGVPNFGDVNNDLSNLQMIERDEHARMHQHDKKGGAGSPDIMTMGFP